MEKFIFVTGGVVSSLGKGIASASIGKLLEARGLSVTVIKCDPYINVDPGTMSPFQHGEVFVTEDGAETDLDLGHYERFLNKPMHHTNNITAGKVYETVIARERRGDFLGSTVQVIPHITDEIKNRFRLLSKGADVVVIEIGMITPPIGLNVFVLHGVASDLSLGTIFRGIVPFLCADIGRLVILVSFPVLITLLPSLF